MPEAKTVLAAIELCKDETKLLGIKVGEKVVTPGLKIPKSGMYSILFCASFLNVDLG